MSLNNPISRAALWLARDPHHLDLVLAIAIGAAAFICFIGAMSGWDFSR